MYECILFFFSYLDFYISDFEAERCTKIFCRFSIKNLGDKKQQLRKSEEKKRIIFISLLQSTTLFIYITLTKVISAKLCLLAFWDT